LYRSNETISATFVSQFALTPLLFVYQQTFQLSKLGEWAIFENS